MRAIWKNVVIAESDDAVVVGRSCASMRSRHWGILPGEGNHYFPAGSIRQERFRSSDHQSVCPWKGTASYCDVVVDGEVNANAAWYYPTPKGVAREITGRVAFWRGVEVTA
ncbi:DUF427 domain-containing protein [Rhodanobacter umsongensis]